MGRMIDIQMDSDDMIDALCDRVRYWTDDSDVIELFEQYYEHMVENGCFDGCEFDVMSIVDNDYVNYKGIVRKDDCSEETWAEILERYENGDLEISDIEDCSGECIEAMNDDKTMILVSY